jgi:H+/Cl- antiporter ClcA/CBS domain-containing protein
VKRFVAGRAGDAVSLGGLCLGCVFLACAAFATAELLLWTIEAVTRLAYGGAPGEAASGWWSVGIPALGGLIVGLMARYGSEAIRGHGIPEAMLQILANRSRISPKVLVLKPVSAAISIGTGGPFGAEGPIIATGGALGSLAGQLASTTAAERRTLLAAGAAAGMASIFGTPLAAVFLSVELLLFEFRLRSLVPVCLAAGTAMGLRFFFHGGLPFFSFAAAAHWAPASWPGCLLVGAVCGGAATAITQAVYWLEDFFEKLPIHWMWWPALGGLGVGLIGHFFPATLGVGYGNIEGILNLQWGGQVVFWLCAMKFLSWWLALGSGTSGGTLAPLLTLGAGVGQLVGVFLQPWLPLDPRLMALVGMGALFAGASRALLASALFAVEATGAWEGSVPVLLGCACSCLVASWLREHSIMTEKITRRGHLVPAHYDADDLLHHRVGALMSTDVPLVLPDLSVSDFLAGKDPPSRERRGACVLLDETGALSGILTRSDALRALAEQGGGARVGEVGAKPVLTVFPHETVHRAVEKMFHHGVGRLVVVDPEQPLRPVGYLGRREILSARRKRLAEDVRDPGWLAAGKR